MFRSPALLSVGMISSQAPYVGILGCTPLPEERKVECPQAITLVLDIYQVNGNKALYIVEWHFVL